MNEKQGKKFNLHGVKEVRLKFVESIGYMLDYKSKHLCFILKCVYVYIYKYMSIYIYRGELSNNKGLWILEVYKKSFKQNTSKKDTIRLKNY